ncbi:hypothetical protein GCM10023205_82210 [Yinghuangia aomiensis]|uniref:Uncharacterized protein n=1 Tax=Yinghuangia aomiensis TaxID=676205 RepID=A0ABP9IGA4_9ACTN
MRAAVRHSDVQNARRLCRGASNGPPQCRQMRTTGGFAAAASSRQSDEQKTWWLEGRATVNPTPQAGQVRSTGSVAGVQETRALTPLRRLSAWV